MSICRRRSRASAAARQQQQQQRGAAQRPRAQRAAMDVLQHALAWINQYGDPSAPCENVLDLCDGVAFARVLAALAPDWFTLDGVRTDASANWVLAQNNLRTVLRNMEDYYRTVLHADMDFGAVDANAIARKDGDVVDQLLQRVGPAGESARASQAGGRRLHVKQGVTELLVGLAVQCENKAQHVGVIMGLPVESQTSLQYLIQQALSKARPYSAALDGAAEADAPPPPPLLPGSGGDHALSAAADAAAAVAALQQQLAAAEAAAADLREQLLAESRACEELQDENRALREVTAAAARSGGSGGAHAEGGEGAAAAVAAAALAGARAQVAELQAALEEREREAADARDAARRAAALRDRDAALRATLEADARRMADELDLAQGAAAVLFAAPAQARVLRPLRCRALAVAASAGACCAAAALSHGESCGVLSPGGMRTGMALAPLLQPCESAQRDDRGAAARLRAAEASLERYRARLEELAPLREHVRELEQQSAQYLEQPPPPPLPLLPMALMLSRPPAPSAAAAAFDGTDDILTLEGEVKAMDTLRRKVEQYKDEKIEMERTSFQAASALTLKQDERRLSIARVSGESRRKRSTRFLTSGAAADVYMMCGSDLRAAAPALEVTRLKASLQEALDAKRYFENELIGARDAARAQGVARGESGDGGSGSTADAGGGGGGGGLGLFESAATLSEKVQRLQRENAALRAQLGGGGSGGSGGGGGDAAAAAELRGELEDALRAKRERGDEALAAKRQVGAQSPCSSRATAAAAAAAGAAAAVAAVAPLTPVRGAWFQRALPSPALARTAAAVRGYREPPHALVPPACYTRGSPGGRRSRQQWQIPCCEGPA
ncbi:hypothetical protein JKP88DRAFT_324142 [Tribonema minus]|uniref:Calponin-homology (CH) domain-containing protein n=1 Tax=Tribonema minus TaxID=303371 RepID=A0A835YRG8_9STRA|nr:hypothetical protein JKP88DRAFT_324142 [Tribonema minus]